MPENNKNIKNCLPCRQNATFSKQISSTQTHPKQLFTVNYSVFCTFEPASRHPKSLQITISNFHPPSTPPSKTYRGETQSDYSSLSVISLAPPSPLPYGNISKRYGAFSNQAHVELNHLAKRFLSAVALPPSKTMSSSAVDSTLSQLK